MRALILMLNFLLAVPAFNVQLIQMPHSTKNQSIHLNGKTIFLKKSSSQIAKKLNFNSSMADLKKMPFTKINGITKLKLFDSSYIVLKDKGEQTDNIDKKVYHLKGLLLERFYVVLANYYETGEYLLIDKKNGNCIALWGEPYVSPDGSHIVSFSGSLDYDMEPNGIQLYDIEADKIKLNWEFKITDWQPEAIAWKGNRTIMVLKVIPDYISSTKKEIKGYSELSF